MKKNSGLVIVSDLVASKYNNGEEYTKNIIKKSLKMDYEYLAFIVPESLIDMFPKTFKIEDQGFPYRSQGIGERVYSVMDGIEK